MHEKDKTISVLSQQNSRVSPTVVGSDGTNSSPPIGQYAPVPKFPHHSDVQSMGQEAAMFGQYPGSIGASGSTSRYASFSSAGALDGVQPIPEGMNSRSTRPAHSSPTSDVHNPNLLPAPGPYGDNYMEIRSWPPNLPSPAVTRHL